MDSVAKTLRTNLEKVFEVTDGRERLNAAINSTRHAKKELSYFAYDQFNDSFFTAPRLFPSPVKDEMEERYIKAYPFPNHLGYKWDECTIRNAAIRAVNWYNCLVSRCPFAICETVPSGVQFIENVEEVDFIGRNTRDWTVVFYDKKQRIRQRRYSNGISADDQVHSLPDDVLGFLSTKEKISAIDSSEAFSRLNLILDELALLCVPLYRDVMQFRELSYVNILSSGRDSPFSLESENYGLVYRCVNASLPEAADVNPHRPFVFEHETAVEDEGDDSSSDESETHGPFDNVDTNRYYEDIGDLRSRLQSFPFEVNAHNSSKAKQNIDREALSLSARLVRQAFGRVGRILDGREKNRSDNETFNYLNEDE